MTDNVIKSTDINAPEPKKQVAKKTTAKKTPAKKVAEKNESSVSDNQISNSSPTKVIFFESGFSYTSGNYVFTRENPMQEIPEEDANFFLSLENFRLPDQLELEEYFNNRDQ